MKYETKEADYSLLEITSSAFRKNESIPAKYTCESINVNPPLNIGGLNASAKSLALIVDDPDAPRGTWVHWVMWNIPVESMIKENDAPGIQGLNDFQKNQYNGPCPPSGRHRYFFKVYALDTTLDLPASTVKSHLEKAMTGHIIAYGELQGFYEM